MTNEEYELLVYSIAYQVLSEEYSEEELLILEKKSNLFKTISNAIKTGKKIYDATAGSKDKYIEKYRNQKQAYEKETDPKEKERLYRKMKNTSADHGVDDNSRKGWEKGVDGVVNGVNNLKNKAKEIINNHNKKNQEGYIGLARMNKEQTT